MTGKSSVRVDEGGRECTKCHRYKTWDEFGPAPRGTNGKNSRCRPCLAAKAEAYRAKDPAAADLYQFVSGLKRKFHMTLEQYEQLLAVQGGVCGLCHEPETRLSSGPRTKGTVQRLSVDHDHSCCPGVKSCGKCVRGLLCARCNWLIGRVEAAGFSLGELKSYLDRRPLALAA